MTIIIRIDTELIDQVSKRAWNPIAKAAHFKQATYWHEKILPRHFKPQAKSKYGHQRRTKRYRKRKLTDAKRGKAILGGVVDNVRTGLLMESLMGLGLVQAFPTRAVLTMFGPSYLMVRLRSTSQPDKASEILEVIPGEADEMGGVLDKAVQRGINRVKNRKRLK